MEGRSKVVVGLGFVVLVAIAALGVQTFLGADGWREEAIAEMGLSADRRTLQVRTEEYLSDSCYEGRADVTTEGERWTVTVESRRTSDFCTMEGCIIEGSGRDHARQLDPGEDLPCPFVTVDLDRPVPEGVRVVPG